MIDTVSTWRETEPMRSPEHDETRAVPAVQVPNGYLGMVARFKYSLAAFLIVFTLLGVGVGYLSPITYTAQGQMIAGATSVNAAAVPSFTQAGESLAETYSRVYTGDEVQRQLVARGFTPASESTTASPIAASSVILIESQATSPAAAVKITNAGIAALDSTVSKLLNNATSVTAAGNALRGAYEQQARAQTDVDQLVKDAAKPSSSKYQAATARLGAAQAAVSASRQLLTDQVSNSVQSNGVHGLTSAHITSSDKAKRLEFWGAIGLVAAVVLWTLFAMARTGALRRRIARR